MSWVALCHGLIPVSLNLVCSILSCAGSAGRDSGATETHQGTGSAEPRTGLRAGAATATGLARRDNQQGAGWRRWGRATCGAGCSLGKCVSNSAVCSYALCQDYKSTHCNTTPHQVQQTLMRVYRIAKKDYLLRHTYLSACPCALIAHFGSLWTDFHEIRYVSILRRFVEKIQVSLKSDEHNSCLS